MDTQNTLHIACVQTSSQNDMEHNIIETEQLVRQAHQQGAKLIALPENVAFMADNGKELLENTYLETEHPMLLAMIELAKHLEVWILIGSLAIKHPDSDKLRNRSYLINNNGHITAFYDKIHLYDAAPEGGEEHKESRRYDAGTKAVIADTPWGKIGLTICYDLRFPHLYRKLAQAGAHIITVPSAFTKFTGEAHWHTLLTARAIENSAYIIAPAQTGDHPANRQTFGHSVIINPWGETLADAQKDTGIITAELDLEHPKQLRQQLPSIFLNQDFQ